MQGSAQVQAIHFFQFGIFQYLVGSRATAPALDPTRRAGPTSASTINSD